MTVSQAEENHASRLIQVRGLSTVKQQCLTKSVDIGSNSNSRFSSELTGSSVMCYQRSQSAREILCNRFGQFFAYV